MSLESIRVCRVVEALFSAAPGNTYLNSFLDEVQQSSIESFSNNFINTYFSSYSNYELSQRIIDNLRVPNEFLRDTATNYFSSSFDSQDDRGTVLIDLLDLLATLESDSTWGDTAELFNAAVEASVIFSQSPNNTTTNIAILMNGDAIDYNNISQSITGDEYNNSNITLGSMELDTFNSGWVNGSIDFEGDHDWFKIDLTADTEYSITVRSQVGSATPLNDPELVGIYDFESKIISNSSNDNYAISFNPLVSYTPIVSGTYYVSVGGNTANNGEYTIFINENIMIDSLDDVSADITTTLEIVVDSEAIKSSIGEAFDTDWVRVQLLAGEMYQIDLEGTDTNEGSLIDPTIIGLFNESVTLIDNSNDNDSGTGTNAQVTYIPTSSGTYYIAVGASFDGIGTYSLAVSKVTGNTVISRSGIAEEVPIRSVRTDIIPETTATTATLTAGSSATGTIDSSGDRDWFRTTLTAGYEYTIDLEGSSTSAGTLGDTYLRGIYNSSGNLISGTTNDDGGTGYNSQVTYTPTSSGTYYIAAGGYGSRTGTYTLSLAAEAPIAGEIPETTATTATLTAGSSATGTIDSSGDRDWFRTTLTAGYEYTIDLEGSSTSAGTLGDTYLRGIYNSSGNLISGTTNDDGGTGTNAQVTYTPTSSGTYYIAAGGYGSRTGTYTLSLAAEAPIIADSIPETTATTATLTAGSSATGTIDSSGDRDWFRTTLTAGYEYTIDLEGSSTSAGTLGDTYLRGIYNSSGNLISGTTNDDGGTGYNSQVTYTPTSSGTYYIAAGGYGYRTGTYTLSLAAEAPIAGEIPETTATTATLTAGSSATGTIDSSGDRDWFRTTLTAGYEYTIDLEGSSTSAGTLSDTYLRGIYNSSGNLISGTTNDDGGTGYNSQVTYTPTSSGTYYIAAGGYSSRTGTYTLSLEAEAPIAGEIPETTATTATLTAGSSATGTIDSSGDRDWFRTTLTAGYEYTIDLEGSSTSAGTLGDTYLRGIYNSSGNLISGTTNDDGGTGYNSQVTYTPTSSGTYYIAAGGYSSRTGTYTLSLEAEAPIIIEPGEIPETTATTATLTAGSSATGTIDSSGDRDWFRTTLTAGYEYTIDLEGSSTSAGTLGDTYLRGIYNSSGNLISGTTNDDGGTGTNAQVTYTPTSSGTYYIAAGGYGSRTGTYTLSLAAEAPIIADSIPETTATTATLTAGSSATGTIDSSGDRDWFRTTLTAGYEYTIDLEGSSTSAGTLGDTYLRGIYNSSGNLISGTTNDDGGTGYNSQVTYTPTSSGTYYIAAGGYGYRTGTYTLSLEAEAPIIIEPGGTRSWNVMVYIAADNNLEAYGLSDINEMEAATGPESSDVYVTTLIDRISGYSSADGNWTDTRIGQIVSDSSTSTISSTLTSIGELNTGDPDTLTNFINWSATNYPAENYALVIWDHGGGYSGVAWDDSNGHDNLTLAEVTSAIDSSIIESFGVVGYDACLMAMVEAAYPLTNYTDYFVASSELEPGDGWEYTGLMNSLFANPQMSAQSLASTMVEAYTNQFSANSYSDHTLSSINTDHLETLFDSLSEFSTTVIDTASSADWDAIIAAHNEATTYGYSSNNYSDLGDFMSTVIGGSVNQSIDSAASNVMTAYELAVDTSQSNMTDASGLSMYFPGAGESVSSSYSVYSPEFTVWGTFLSELTQQQEGLVESDLWWF